MGFNYPSSGLNNVSEYLASGLPWVTSSVADTNTTKIDFPYVTNFVEVANHASASTLQVGFTENGVLGSNYFSVEPNTTRCFRFRIRSLFLKAASDTVDYDVTAGLTHIKSMFVLTGSAQYASGNNPYTNEYGYPGLG